MPRKTHTSPPTTTSTTTTTTTAAPTHHVSNGSSTIFLPHPATTCTTTTTSTVHTQQQLSNAPTYTNQRSARPNTMAQRTVSAPPPPPSPPSPHAVLHRAYSNTQEQHTTTRKDFLKPSRIIGERHPEEIPDATDECFTPQYHIEWVDGTTTWEPMKKFHGWKQYKMMIQDYKVRKRAGVNLQDPKYYADLDRMEIVHSSSSEADSADLHTTPQLQKEIQTQQQQQQPTVHMGGGEIQGNEGVLRCNNRLVSTVHRDLECKYADEEEKFNNPSPHPPTPPRTTSHPHSPHRTSHRKATRTTTPRRAQHTQHTHTQAQTHMNTHTYTIPTPPTTRPSIITDIHHTHLGMWRNICRIHFNKYAEIHSKATDRQAAIECMKQIMALPQQVLQRGTNQQIKSAMREYIQHQQSNTTPSTATPHASNATTQRNIPNNIHRCINMIKVGGKRCLQRGIRALVQRPLASFDDQGVLLHKLQQLHPPARDHTPLVYPADAPQHPMINIDDDILRDIVKNKIHNGSAPGPSGWSGHMLYVLMEDEKCFDGIKCLTSDLVNGFTQHTDMHMSLMSALLIAVEKPNGNGIRPIAMGEIFYKLAVHYAMKLVENHLPSLFDTIQHGVGSSGGADKAVQLIRHSLDHYRKECNGQDDIIVLTTDITNAFNSMDRKIIWNQLLANPCTQPLWRLFQSSYGQPTPLYVYDKQEYKTTIMSETGVRQGDVLGAFGFAMGVQPAYEKCIAGLKVSSFAIQDDLTFVGSAAQVFTAYDRFKESLSELNLCLAPTKCHVLMPKVNTNTHSDQDSDQMSAQYAMICEKIAAAANERNLCIQHSDLQVLGVYLSHNDEQIEEWCYNLVSSDNTETDRMFQALVHPAMPVQIANLLLRYCMVPRMNYLCRTIHPRHIHTATMEFDKRVLHTFCTINNIDEDRTSETLQSQLQLPLRLGGFGLRSATTLSHIAYVSSLMSMMSDYQKLFPTTAYSIDGHTFSTSLVCQSLEEEWKEVQQMGIDLTATIKHRDAAEVAQKCTAGTHVTFPAQTQHTMTHMLENHVYSNMQVEYKEWDCKEELARYQSLSTEGTSRWLTVLPTCPQYTINDSQYQCAVAHRCGITIADLHKAGVFKCMCGHDASTDHRHFHTCRKLTGGGTTIRHNNMVFTLAQRLQELHLPIVREPLYKNMALSTRHMHPDRAARMSEEKEDDDNNVDENTSQLRGDLAVVCDTGGYLIDVSVVQADADTYIKQGAHEESRLAIKHMEKHKTEKYENFCLDAKLKMVPFVYDSYGCIGQQALVFLQKMSTLSPSPAEWLTHTLNCLSMCLQRSNAQLLSRARCQCVVHDLQRSVAVGYVNSAVRLNSHANVDHVGYTDVAVIA